MMAAGSSVDEMEQRVRELLRPVEEPVMVHHRTLRLPAAGSAGPLTATSRKRYTKAQRAERCRI